MVVGEDFVGQKEPEVEFAFWAGLLTFQRMQNRALGIKVDTQMTSLLLKLSNQVYKNLEGILSQQMVQKAIITGFIKGYAQKIETLVSNAKTSEEKRAILPEVQDLMEKQQELQKVLNG
jgi:uncharacterized protein YeeX (DUF496 family)